MTGVGTVGWDALAADVPLPEPVRLEGLVTADVVVVGAGATGLAAAEHAALRGASVRVVDAVGVGAGAAGRNGGFLLAGLADFHHDAVVRHGRRRAIDWYHRTEEEIDRIAERHPGLVRRHGSLRIADSEAELVDVRAQLEAMRRDGLLAGPYAGAEGQGLLVPRDAVINPVARCRALAAAAVGAGAVLHAPAVVTVMDSGADEVAVEVIDDQDEVQHVQARHAVVAVDGGLEHLLPELHGRVSTSRLQMLSTSPDRGVTYDRPIYRRWGFDYAQQLPTGELFVGGGRDRHEDAEFGAPAMPSGGVQDHLDAWLRQLGATAPVRHRWAAHAAFTLDSLPIAEEVRPRVNVVGAYSGHGNVLGPMLAREAVDAALDGRPFWPMRPGED